MLDLPKGATPLDFAYAVHTEIGHSCRGAKVNGRIVPLTYVLKSGEKSRDFNVEKINPNRNWLDRRLGYLKSPHSIQKVKAWFRDRGVQFRR